jgi:16S rRNA (guanine527-N7)-methyltransferase
MKPRPARSRRAGAASRPAPRNSPPPRKRPRDASAAAVERLLARQRWDRVEPLVQPVASDAAGVMRRLRDFCSRVLTWNRSVSNLISRTDEGRIVERHLVESLEPVGWLAASGARNWIDFGSGAGFPAIPLALVGVGARWTLVESRRIKSLFLRKTLADMGLDGAIEVVNARLENVTSPARFDGFTARAAGKAGETLSHAAPLVTSGGCAFLWKGSRWREEVEQERSWEREWRMSEQRALTDTTIVVLKFIRL